MARQRKRALERKALINSLLEYYQPNDAQDVQETLKELLGEIPCRGCWKMKWITLRGILSMIIKIKKSMTAAMVTAKKWSLPLWGRLNRIFQETGKMNSSLRLSPKTKEYLQH